MPPGRTQYVVPPSTTGLVPEGQVQVLVTQHGVGVSGVVEVSQAWVLQLWRSDVAGQEDTAVRRQVEMWIGRRCVPPPQVLLQPDQPLQELT